MAEAEPCKNLPTLNKEKKDMQIQTGVREQNRQVIKSGTNVVRLEKLVQHIRQ